jgi:hypothetical protein
MVPEAEQRDAALPEAERPEAELPEAELPEAELPEAELPEAELPEAEDDSEDYNWVDPGKPTTTKVPGKKCFT